MCDHKHLQFRLLDLLVAMLFCGLLMGWASIGSYYSLVGFTAVGGVLGAIIGVLSRRRIYITFGMMLLGISLVLALTALDPYASVRQ